MVTYTAGHVISKRPFDYRPTLKYGVCSCRCHSNLHGTGGGTPRARINEHRRLAFPLTPGDKGILEQLLRWSVEGGKTCETTRDTALEQFSLDDVTRNRPRIRNPVIPLRRAVRLTRGCPSTILYEPSTQPKGELSRGPGLASGLASADSGHFPGPPQQDEKRLCLLREIDFETHWGPRQGCPSSERSRA